SLGDSSVQSTSDFRKAKPTIVVMSLHHPNNKKVEMESAEKFRLDCCKVHHYDCLHNQRLEKHFWEIRDETI
ncbi:hypothetical protein, partial [Enterobacter hormaechei]|uniref:hypothetical protein n=1 Tax=Enterobacter hormaechei TaxID=158836 RepID=UPI001C3E8AA8